MTNISLSRRGVVLTVNDFSDKWIELIYKTGLNVLGLHGDIEEIIKFINSEYGASFIEKLKKNDISIEYEIHAMSYLLPRSEFEKHPDWFRMDDKGVRVPDGNLCPSSKDAIETVCANAMKLAELLLPTTNRYYFWADDTKSWCRCRKCDSLSASEQNLIVMNAIIKELRRNIPDAILANLAYLNTLEAPQNVKPEEGIFLEFAPINRRFDASINDGSVTENAKHIEKIDKLIEVFGSDNAQVLEYWLDSSLFSKYTKPAVEPPFDEIVFKEDVSFYLSKGFRSITTFAVYLDEEYFRKYGDDIVIKYGKILKGIEPRKTRRYKK